MYRRTKVRGRRYKRKSKRYGRANKYRKYRTRKIAKKALRSVAKINQVIKTAHYLQKEQFSFQREGPAYLNPTRIMPFLQPNAPTPFGATWETQPIFAQNATQINGNERVRHERMTIKMQWDMASEKGIRNNSFFLIKPTKYGAQAVRAFTTGTVPTMTENIDWVGTPGAIFLNPRLWKTLWKKEFQQGMEDVTGVIMDQPAGTNYTEEAVARPVHKKWTVRMKTGVILEQFAQSSATGAWNQGGQPRYVWDNVFLVTFTDDGTIINTFGTSILTVNVLHTIRYT